MVTFEQRPKEVTELAKQITRKRVFQAERIARANLLKQFTVRIFIFNLGEKGNCAGFSVILFDSHF